VSNFLLKKIATQLKAQKNELPGVVLTDWRERVFQHWDHITALSVRRFGSTSFAEEAVLAAVDGLSKDDWQRLKNYKGQASFKSYLTVLVVRLFEDFSRKRFGRVRPPAWVKSLGGVWPKLFVALCLERLGVDWAVEVVHQRDESQTKKKIEEAAFTLLARMPNCGAQTGETTFDDCTENQMAAGTGGSSAGDRSYETKESVQLIEDVFSAICGEDSAIDSKVIQEQFSRLKILLTSEERLLLKLHFQDGMNITRAGRMLELNRFQVHGKMKRLMERLRAEFERVGLAEEIRQMLRLG